MRFIDEYRDLKLVQAYVEKIHEITTREWTIMEICGGQTHTIIKYGIDEMLPDKINIVHGPGCPVCVTPLEIIDKAIEIASTPGVIFCSFGDMLRVPGSKKDLFTVKSEGADVRIVYSPLDAVKIAIKNPDKKVVFFAIGFETTAPANAMAVWRAKELGLKNFFVLVSHVRVPPAMITILESPWNMINGFIAAGHVCTVMGYEEYEPIAKKYKVPIVVTGFEPVDILQGIFMLIKQLEEGRYEVENQYTRSVRREGNIPAKQLIFKVFEIADMKWRGIGLIPQSGFKLKKEFEEFDAEKVFSTVADINTEESQICISGYVLQGVKKPSDCPAFGTLCTPLNPLGAPMVSSEGACAAYYNYGRLKT
ncbi:hydrogenase formation protein HypD [Candidatus Chrysopegis kryptomonas]|uniref:Hydrogenase expression/formation protein HypD n=1 Tax=Candidatus Chryseopegocella kryptomonas TaxID=1633643 RepID=A0A0N7MVW8_9BACT|nr:hydrogenase formation protein HypD [Candidatus Chrysopegis kryptomonas]CUS97003.1 hydrogenase expression/formation protein HypD [Candidatus Chrysopegis kryptomonas]